MEMLRLVEGRWDTNEDKDAPAREKQETHKKLGILSFVMFALVLCVASLTPSTTDSKLVSETEAVLETSSPQMSRVPVFIDTDIGTDMDDSWAVALALQSPELDVKLITTASGDTQKRAKILGRYLKDLGQETPIGIGLWTDKPDSSLYLYETAKDFSWTDYKESVFVDGVQRMVDLVNEESKQGRRAILLALGPMTNVAAAVALDPDFRNKVHLVAMGGSVKLGIGGSKGAFQEYNIRDDVTASQTVFGTLWASFALAPLDCTWNAQIIGDAYASVRDSQSVASQVLLSDYTYWASVCPWANEGASPADPALRSSVLYDPVAVYLAVCVARDVINGGDGGSGEVVFDGLNMQPLELHVTSDAYTVADDTMGLTQVTNSASPTRVRGAAGGSSSSSSSEETTTTAAAEMMVGMGWTSFDVFESWVVDNLEEQE